MRLRSIFALTAAVVVIAVAPAAAITGGTPDSATSPRYPEVVAIGYPPPPDAPPEEQGLVFQSCTATLVADTVAGQARLLTAGHCAAPPDVPLHVSFAADAPPTHPRGFRSPARLSSSRAPAMTAAICSTSASSRSPPRSSPPARPRQRSRRPAPSRPSAGATAWWSWATVASASRRTAASRT